MSEIEYFNEFSEHLERVVRNTPDHSQRGGRRQRLAIITTVCAAAFVLAAVLAANLVGDSPQESSPAADPYAGVTITAAGPPAPPTGAAGKTVFTATLDHPLPGANHPIPLGAASLVLGAPVALSTIPGMARGDIGRVFGERILDGDTGNRDESVVAVTYPAVGAIVTYGRCPSIACPPQDTAAEYHGIVRQHPEYRMAVVTVGGVAALYVPPASLTFVKHGTQVTIMIPGATRREVTAVGESIARGT